MQNDSMKKTRIRVSRLLFFYFFVRFTACRVICIVLKPSRSFLIKVTKHERLRFILKPFLSCAHAGSQHRRVKKGFEGRRKTKHAPAQCEHPIELSILPDIAFQVQFVWDVVALPLFPTGK